MYEEKKKRNINWKSLIIKILLLALIVFLIIWVIQINTKRNNEQNDTKVFNQNIATMKESSESYYKSNKLPENIGDKDKITLEEMIDNNLLMEFTDKNGNFCDEKNSYAQVTKTKENVYQLKVLLSCDDNTDYLVKNLTIENNKIDNKENKNQTSEDNKEVQANEDNNEKSVDEINKETNNVDYVDEKVQNEPKTETVYEKKKVYSYTTQYEFRKLLEAESSKYTCPDGYSLLGDKCFKSIIESEIDATATYYDDEEIVTDPLEKVEDDTKEYVDPIEDTADITYTCPSGYIKTGTGEDTKCYKIDTVAKNSSNATPTCPDGYSISGNTCVKVNKATSIAANKKCPDGYSVSGSSCVKLKKPTKKAANKKYSCTKGSLSGTKCYYCPSGYKQTGSGANISCYKYVTKYKTSYSKNWYVYTTKKSTSPLDVYKTNTEKMVFNYSKPEPICSKCTKKRTYYYYTIKRRKAYKTAYSQKVTAAKKVGNAKVNYSCKKGTRTGAYCYFCKSGTTTGKGSNTKCKFTKKLTYKCPSSVNGSVSGSKCYYCKSGTKSGSGSNMTCKLNSNLNYTCKTGTKNGTKCYTCPSGYNQTSSAYNAKCNKTNYISVIENQGTSYSCPEGYTQEGSGDTIKCYKTVAGKTTYYCEDSAAKLGEDNKCHKTVKGEIKEYTCPEGYAINDKKCYKTTDETIDANKETTEAKYDYIWSNNSTLDGWEFTGNTRTITNEDEVTVASPHTGIFDSENIIKNIMLLGFLGIGIGFITYLSIKSMKNKKHNIIG